MARVRLPSESSQSRRGAGLRQGGGRGGLVEEWKGELEGGGEGPESGLEGGLEGMEVGGWEVEGGGRKWVIRCDFDWLW